ncbi:MAG: hypothetical protein FJ405_13215 [Verrucomicrobia bacterium]|nr:hypothetical protein [Verrucomicrobiota bacterium]
MKSLIKHSLALLGASSLFLTMSGRASAAVDGWLAWRGPEQTGVSRQTGLPSSVDASKPLWSAPFPGQSTPVIANGKLHVLGYLGDGADLQEGVTCFDAETGKKEWSRLYNDYLSDTIYLRYSTASPAIDGETGNVYMQGTQGILAAFRPDGTPLWEHSMMEAFGRLTFPNSRTASPVVDRDLIIARGITANWGAQGAAGDRFYAFDKKTGQLIWTSSPGDRPKDNSFSHPYLGWHQGRRALFAATGDGSVVCLNARTGDPIWRVPLFRAGINATVLVHNDDKVVAIFGTPYELGQMVGLKIPDVYPDHPTNAPVVVERSKVELWSAEVSTSTSSPILVGDRIYVVAEKGDLCAMNVNTGEVLWKIKLGIEQRNACPLYADGKLYVPILDSPDGKGEGDGGSEAGTKGGFYIIQPGDKEGKILQKVTLEGRCFGSPVAYNGKIYLQTTEKIYCWGKPGTNPGLPKPIVEKPWPAPGPATQLQIIPAEVLLHPGEKASFRVRSLDAKGFVVQENIDPKSAKWESYIPSTARVRSLMKGGFNEKAELVAAKDPAPSAGAFQASIGNLKGTTRGRVLTYFPMSYDFEEFALSETTTNTIEAPTAFAYPPLPWIGARFKFEVRDKDGTKALTKTIDNKFFQRAVVFIGDEHMKNYTIQADVMSEGARRKMSEVGLINQRYIIVLKGNDQKLEVNSNLERIRVPAATDAPNFRWAPNTWYTLKARVDVAGDGSAVVRAKAWKRGDEEPSAWTIEVPHKTAHKSGSPGLFGFSPQEMRVFIDNVKVTANN